MKIEVVKNLDLSAWDKFIKKSNNGTIFHMLRFLQYHPLNKFKWQNLIFFENGKICAVLPGSVNKGIFCSPTGSSYGSIVFGDTGFNDYEKIIDCFLDYCKKSKIKEVFLTPPPLPYVRNMNEIDRFILSYKGFTPKTYLISNSVNLNQLPTKKEEIIESFTPMFRRAVKKSFKEGVYVEISDDYETFYKMLLKNKEKFSANPTHTLDEMKKIHNILPDKTHLFMAYSKEKKPIAGIWLITCNSSVSLAFYIAHYYQYQNLRAVNRLFFEVVNWSKKNKYGWLDLGVSMDTLSKNEMEPSRNLIHFKEGIQTRGFLRIVYHWKRT